MALFFPTERPRTVYTPMLDGYTRCWTTLNKPYTDYVSLPPVFSDVPDPDIPESEDYAEFSGLVRKSLLPLSSREKLLLFKELFITDSEDHIIGVANNLTNPDLDSTMRCNYEDVILKALQSVRVGGEDPNYPKLGPWVDAVREEVSARGGFRRKSDPEFSPYGGPMFELSEAYNGGRYKMAYPEILVRAAIKSNFDEGDPDRDLLLTCIPQGKSRERTEASKWFRRDCYDFRKDFTDESLVGMKPALLAYLKDLKALQEAYVQGCNEIDGHVDPNYRGTEGMQYF